MWLPILFLCIFHNSESLKVLHIVPAYSTSHLVFNYRVANATVSQGHTVTLWTQIQSGLELKNLAVNPQIKEHRLDFRDKVQEIHTVGERIQQAAWMKPNIFDREMSKILSDFLAIMLKTCKIQLEEYDELIEELRHENFDVALIHSFDYCPIAIASKIGIPSNKFIFLSPGTYITDLAANILSIPSTPSYVPVMFLKYNDYMGFFQRVLNLMGFSFQFFVFGRNSGALGKQIQMFREPPNNDLPDLYELAQNVSGIMVNGERYLDFPRPLPYGASFLSELGKKKKSATKRTASLSAKFKKIVEIENKGIILLSFGTVANTSTMPRKIALSLLEGVAQFPEYSVIWKFELEELPEIANYSHIYPVKWIPQRELLQNEKTKLFITHAGYNSLLETTKAGKPMVLCPLFGDQDANAIRAVRFGLGLMVDLKSDDFSGQQLAEKIHAVLGDKKYERNAKKLAAVFDDRLISAEEALSHTLKQVAKKHSRFPTLYRTHQLNFFQYYCLDVIGFWLGLTFFTVFTIVKTLLCICRKLTKNN